MSRSIVKEQIRHFTEQGKWMLQAVPSSHVYTIGLTERPKQMTELIVLGKVNPESLGRMLNGMVDVLIDRDRSEFEHTERVQDDNFAVPFVVLDVKDEATIRDLGAQAFYHYEGARTPRFQQVVWPDAQGRFPWDAGSDFQAGGKYEGLQAIVGELPEFFDNTLPQSARYVGD